FRTLRRCLRCRVLTRWPHGAPSHGHPARATILEVVDARWMPAVRYVKPSWLTRVFNVVPSGLARVGISVYGSRTLAVRGRKSGEWRTVRVNLLIHDGTRSLVAPRGETQWVRNLRSAGRGELRLGQRHEPFRATELRDTEKPPVLRAYLRK